MFDLSTILKAVEFVGENTPSALNLLQSFVAVTHGETQDELKARLASARAKSDADHAVLQRELRP